MVENPRLETDGALPLLWNHGEREEHLPVLSAGSMVGIQVVEPTEPEKERKPNRFCEDGLASSTTASPHCLFIPSGRDVSFAEEPYMGKLYVRFREGMHSLGSSVLLD